jgi:6-pyruvoyltetrahydropterin/6-carboxytetrahydropterin synthase
MYEITVRRHFDAAHFLREYGGRCENLHGHRYEVEVTVESDHLNSIGLVMDFTGLKTSLDQLLESYDHRCLNDLPPYDRVNPSAENLARNIYQALKTLMPVGEAHLASVRVYESPDAWATFRP